MPRAASLARAGLLSPLSLLLLACPARITDAIVDNARDLLPPVISVTSPAEYASYSRDIAISGRVSDLAEGGASGRVESLSYEILSHSSSKPAALAADGSFSISEPNDLRENIVVLLRAVDWNGNQAEFRLPLTFPGNEIPSFSAVEGNRQTTLSWSPVPGVTSYTLYIEPSAKTPDPALSPAITGVSPPYVVGQLKNASLYSFLLEGTTADGRKNYSAVTRSIPLSSLHLLPRVDSYFNGVEVTWRTFPAIASYRVLRAADPAGPWSDVSGPLPAPPFFDASAARGASYYYAVQPESHSSVRSEWVEAMVDPVAGRSDEAVASFDAVSSSQMSVWRDGRLYVADYYYGLRILDVGVPELPRSLGQVPISSARSVALSGSFAFVTGWKSLHIVDISNPASPSLVSSLPLSAGAGFQAEGVAVLGDLVFVAGFNEGFCVVDVSVKAAPVVRLSDVDAGIFVQNYSVAVSDRATDVLAVAGNSTSALYTVTGTAASPVLTRVSVALPAARDLEFSGTILVLSSNWSILTYQTATPSAPLSLGSTSPAMSVAGVAGLSLSGSRAFVALTQYGFAVVDFSAPASPATIRVRTVPGDATHAAVGGGYAYISTGTDYPLQIYGANDPSAASIVLTKTDVGTGARLAAYRDYLYVSESGSGDWKAASYAIATPAATTRFDPDIGSYTPYDFAFAGSRSYVAAERSGIMMWESASPYSPGSPSVIPPWYSSVPGGNAWAIALSGNYAILGTSNSWIASVDLARPDSLTIVGSVQTQGTASATTEIRGLALRGNLAFVANETAGLRVVDLADPGFPVALSGYGALPAAGSAAAVAMSGDFAFVADSVNGLLVYDGATARSWSSGGQARVWPSVTSGGGALDVVVRGKYAYVAKGAAGLQIFDISDPRSPVAAGTLVAAGFSPVRLALYKEHLYALDGATKLYVIDLVP